MILSFATSGLGLAMVLPRRRRYVPAVFANVAEISAGDRSGRDPPVPDAHPSPSPACLCRHPAAALLVSGNELSYIGLEKAESRAFRPAFARAGRASSPRRTPCRRLEVSVHLGARRAGAQ